MYLFICVCQVGGIKQKVLAAHRAGLQRVILPARNEKDLHEIPANIKVSSLSVLCVCVHARVCTKCACVYFVCASLHDVCVRVNAIIDG
jgi:ATP-dependent Lon protease